MLSTTEQIALINRYIPEEAKLPENDGGYGWDDSYISSIIEEHKYRPAQVVRYFWYQRTAETVEYLDMAKPLAQIHQQAKAMLEYWDKVLETNPTFDGMEPIDDNGLLPLAVRHKAVTFGTIERPWV